MATTRGSCAARSICAKAASLQSFASCRSEEHTSELQSQFHLVCRLLLEKKKHTHVTCCASGSVVTLSLTLRGCASRSLLSLPPFPARAASRRAQGSSLSDSRTADSPRAA